VVRTEELSKLHKEIFEIVSGYSTNSIPYYFPDNWTPHITIAQGDCLVPEKLGDLLSIFGDREFHWSIEFDCLGLIVGTKVIERIYFQ